MNEFNINITENNINAKDLGNNLSITEAKSQDKTLNILNFHKIASNFIKQSLQPRKSKWTKKVLLELAHRPVTFRSINDLAGSTHLSNVIYPVLAKLHRQGVVEARPYKDTKGTILTYRLTERGFAHSKTALA